MTRRPRRAVGHCFGPVGEDIEEHVIMEPKETKKHTINYNQSKLVAYPDSLDSGKTTSPPRQFILLPSLSSKFNESTMQVENYMNPVIVPATVLRTDD